MADLLIQDAPKEIIHHYFEALDLKSAIKFASCSKSLQELLNQYILSKEINTVFECLQTIVYQLATFYEGLMSYEGKKGMLAYMLRRMIHTTAIYDTIDDEVNTTYTKYYDEYNNLFLYVNEEMEMDLKEFNTYLENAQFEYRGFNIIGQPHDQRSKLDTFKSIIEARYFNEPFKLQAYFAFLNNMFIEVIYDGETVEFDFHMRRSEDGQWIFIDHVITETNTQLKHVKEKNRMLCFSASDDDAIKEVIEILYTLFNNVVKGVIVQGAEQTTLSVWNNVYEENVLLAETIHRFMSSYGIESILHNITMNAIGVDILE